MKTINEDLKLDTYQSKAFDMYFGRSKIAVFDIETTGLFANNSKIMLSGILDFPETHGAETRAKVTQFFSDKADEYELIKSTVNYLNNFDVLITYNGKSFDIPFLNKRAEKHDLSLPKGIYNLDIYQIVKFFSPISNILDSLKQKYLERYLGLGQNRTDEISGKESIDLYKRYLINPTEDLENKILLHNRDDIVQLSRLLSVLKNCDLHKAMYNLGFPISELGIIVEKIEFKNETLYINATSPQSEVRDYISFPNKEKPYMLTGISSLHRIEIQIPAEKLAKGTYIIDASKILSYSSVSDFYKHSPFAAYPNVESGYLIVSKNSNISYLELNSFAIFFIISLKKAGIIF